MGLPIPRGCLHSQASAPYLALALVLALSVALLQLVSFRYWHSLWCSLDRIGGVVPALLIPALLWQVTLRPLLEFISPDALLYSCR